jgi:sugar lactone lactonase YvrE
VTEREVRTIVTGGGFFEGPRWHDGAWWVSDFHRHAVYRVTPDGEETVVAEVEHQPSGLGFLPDGSLVIASMRNRQVLRWADGEISTYADLTGYGEGHVNDLIVDRHGHVFVGDFGYDTSSRDNFSPTTLKRIDLDGSVHIAADDLWFPNAMVITDDGSSMIVGESIARRYSAFDLAADGSLTNRRVWAELGDQRGDGQSVVVPDGCALDAEGCLWIADALTPRFVRVAEGGKILESITPPDGLGSFACMLGGEDGRTLLLCCAPGYSETVQVGRGLLATTTVDVARAGLP